MQEQVIDMRNKTEEEYPEVATESTRSIVVKLSEISDTELRARTRRGVDEWKPILDAATGKNVRLRFSEYREARACAARLSSVRKYYGHEVKIQQRGLDVFISPRQMAVILKEEDTE